MNFTVPFSTIDWTQVPPVEHPGEVGKAIWRTVETENLRVRIVEYSKGYRADHWCNRWHVVFVLEGELITELQGGRRFSLSPGQTYQVGDAQEPHRSSTDTGAKLFIVD